MSSTSRRLIVRVCVTAALVLAAVTSAEAQRSAECQNSSCFVRIIWDVGTQAFYVRTYSFTSEQRWSFPERDASGGFKGFTEFDRGNRRVIRRGDHVRLHVTNYNPVSHKPAKGQVLTLTPEVPFSVSLLSAIVAAASGGAAPTIKTREAAPERSPSRPDVCEPSSFRVRDCLDLASNGIRDTFRRLDELRGDLETFKKLDDAVNGFGDLPSNWEQFDNGQVDGALDALVDALVPGDKYSAFARKVDDLLNALTASIVDASSAASSVDVNCAAQQPNDGQFSACLDAAPRREQVHNGLTALTQQLLDTSNTRTDIAVGVTRYQNAKGVIRSMKRKLDLQNEANFVADVDVTTSAPDNGRLVLDMPFGSQEKDSTKQTTVTVVLRTSEEYPGLFATVGVLAVLQPFDFQDAVLVDKINAENTNVNKVWDVKPSDKFLPLGAALLTHAHIGAEWAPAFYASFGTTIDKNVFSNLLVGGSVYVPRARAMITVGVLGAKGSVEEDLQTEFNKLKNADGFALGSAGELPDTRKFHWRPVVSLSFKPF